MIAICYLLSVTCCLWLDTWIFWSETCYYLQNLVLFPRCCTSRNFWIMTPPLTNHFHRSLPQYSFNWTCDKTWHLTNVTHDKSRPLTKINWQMLILTKKNIWIKFSLTKAVALTNVDLTKTHRQKLDLYWKITLTKADTGQKLPLTEYLRANVDPHISPDPDKNHQWQNLPVTRSYAWKKPTKDTPDKSLTKKAEDKKIAKVGAPEVVLNKRCVYVITDIRISEVPCSEC